MFSNRVANSASFLQMPAESQLLFFHMVLRADDDGVVESYPILKLLGVAPDSFKVLLARGYVKQLNEDQVVVISEWLEHNTIRADRKVDSIYLPVLLAKYPETEIVVAKPRSDVYDNTRRLDRPWTAEGKLSKGKLILGESEIRIENIDDKEVKPKADTSYRRVFELWGKDYPLNWRSNRTEIEAAKNISTELEGDLTLATKMLGIYQKHKSHQFCPSILCPSDLDRKWDKLKEFNKKHG